MTIGLIDTGIDPTQKQLNGSWASGSSTGRWHRKSYTQAGDEPYLPKWTDRCGHGTHEAGVIGAPLNGNGTVGIAHRANLITVRHDGDVWAPGFSVFATAAAIDTAAANHGARIIEMAFGSDEAFNIIEDKIRYWSNRERLFIGAAGTTFCANPFKGVLFPADLPDVFAVTATDGASGEIACASHRGSEVELTAPTPTPTTGNLLLFDDPIAESGQSSNASAMVSAIAALIWSRYPSMTRNQVRARLHFAGHLYPVRDGDMGYGTIIAHKAVGGMYRAFANGPRRIVTNEDTYVRYTAVHYGGDGPYTYKWQNGKTSKSITFEVPAPAPGSTNSYNIRLTVIDRSDGTTIMNRRTLTVEGCIPDKTCDA